MYVITAGAFTREKRRSSRGSCELCQFRLLNFLSVLFADLLLTKLLFWVVNTLCRCGSKQQDAFTVHVKGSRQHQHGRAIDHRDDAVGWGHICLMCNSQNVATFAAHIISRLPLSKPVGST